MRKILTMYFVCLIQIQVNAQWMQFGPINGAGDVVTGMCVYQNQMYVCGAVSSPTQPGVNYYNGSVFVPSYQFHQHFANGLIEYGGRLLAYGLFDPEAPIPPCLPVASSLAIWFDGVRWCADGSDVYVINGGTINTAIIYNSELYVGGNINFFDFNGNRISGVAKWNGSTWVSPGFYLGLNNINGGIVYSFEVFQGSLYVGGFFNRYNNIPLTSQNIGFWNGTSFQATTGSGFNQQIQSMKFYQSQLWIGGGFTSANGSPAKGLVKYDGVNYSLPSFSPNNPVITMCVFQGKLFISTNAASTLWVGTVPYRLFSFNGSSTMSEETGIVFQTPQQAVLCLYVEPTLQYTLFAGGSFTKVGGMGINYTAYIGSPLPIELGNWEVECDEKDKCARLLWSTYSEHDNEGFVVERSIDGVHFDAVDRVAGAGTTNTIHAYEYCDTYAYQKSMYYRLRQVDYSGEETLLGTRHVHCIQKMEDKMEIQAAGITITTNESGTLSIVNMMGTIVLSKKIQNDSFISIADLKKGTYIATWKKGEETISKNFIKQD